MATFVFFQPQSLIVAKGTLEITALKFLPLGCLQKYIMIPGLNDCFILKFDDSKLRKKNLKKCNSILVGGCSSSWVFRLITLPATRCSSVKLINAFN